MREGSVLNQVVAVTWLPGRLPSAVPRTLPPARYHRYPHGVVQTNLLQQTSLARVRIGTTVSQTARLVTCHVPSRVSRCHAVTRRAARRGGGSWPASAERSPAAPATPRHTRRRPWDPWARRLMTTKVSCSHAAMHPPGGRDVAWRGTAWCGVAFLREGHWGSVTLAGSRSTAAARLYGA